MKVSQSIRPARVMGPRYASQVMVIVRFMRLIRTWVTQAGERRQAVIDSCSPIHLQESHSSLQVSRSLSHSGHGFGEV